MTDQRKQNSTVNEKTETAPSRYVQTMDLAFLGSLVPGIIHNMATPLSGVLGATQLLEKRVSNFESLLQGLDSLNETTRTDLVQQLERNRTNVEILAKNAKHLADILQVIVRRINRGGITTPELHSLPDLVRSELQFLDSNLVFKHKVKKTVEPLSDVPLTRFVYGYVAATMDEFVSGTLALHDPALGTMEMSFATNATPETVTFAMQARFKPRMQQPSTLELLEPCLECLRDDGWNVEWRDEPGHRELRITRKPLLPTP